MLFYLETKKQNCESLWIIRIYLDNRTQSQSPFTIGNNETSRLTCKACNLTSPPSQPLFFNRHLILNQLLKSRLSFSLRLHNLGMCWQPPFVVLTPSVVEMEGPRFQAVISRLQVQGHEKCEGEMLLQAETE